MKKITDRYAFPAPGRRSCAKGPELRTVIFAGEPFPVEQVRTLAERTDAELLDPYGPTETNVCTRHRVTTEDLSGDQPLPIGTAVCADTVRPSIRTERSPSSGGATT
jgi:acyl-coenzyme A synthetase/AMP-(fatty) acid ligase